MFVIFFGGGGWRGGKAVFAKKNSFEILSIQDAWGYLLCAMQKTHAYIFLLYEYILLVGKLNARTTKSWT